MEDKKELGIKASEARELAGPTVEEMIAELLGAVEEAAREGKRRLRTGWEYTKHSTLWITGGHTKSKNWFEAKRILETMGYVVSFYYKEESIAVDMYTVIEW